jgi:UDP-N-acetylglucosamine 2-epimerase (non-hydrolysing)/GDP/UDP-N,N'-diacetylbacillosamine 2-epimerase (hydrolysing)
MSPEFGRTGDLVRELDLPCIEVESLLSSDTDVGMAKTIGVTTLGVTDAMAALRPDLMLLIADRYEMLAPASVALALRIPIAHIEGGEISEGAIDDAVRNALTKMSHLHFTPTELARDRVIAMGEQVWRVHHTGAPSIDYLTHMQLMESAELEAHLGHSLKSPVLVVAYHPLTLSRDTLIEADAFFSALQRLSGQVVFCFPNADAGSRQIIERARNYCESGTNAHLHVNLPPEIYWSLLARADVMLGNSSSGIMETPSLGLPCVNVGDRQCGRQRAANIIDVPADTDAIINAVDSATAASFRDRCKGLENPYGDGHAGERIAKLLANAPDTDRLLHKRALPLVETSGAEGRMRFGEFDDA